MKEPKKRILIIEDDQEMRFLLKDLIEEQPEYEVEEVSDGAEAFPKLMGKDFDLIITDIRMPGLSGLDIIPGLRNLQPGVSIIAITAFGSEEIQRKALARGAQAYLEKPVPLDRLRRLIEELIAPPKTV